MRHGRTRLLSLLAVATAVIVLAACGGGGSPNGSGGLSGTLVWYVNKTPTLTPALYKKIADGFTKTHPSVHVHVIDQGGQPLDSYFRTLISSGNTPDVGEGLPITSHNAKNFVSLDNQPWAKTLVQKNKLARQYEVGGHIYTIPIGFQVHDIIFYNKALFKRAGITQTPTTYAGLTADMKKLKQLGVTPMATSNTFIPGSQVEELAWQQIFQTNTHWEADKSAGKVTFANSPWQEVMTNYQNWIKAGYIRKDALGLQFDTVNTDFLDGKYGLYPVDSWFTGNINQTPPKFPLGVFPMPALNGKTPPPVEELGAFDWEIPTAAKHQDLAVAFVHYLDTNKTAISSLVKADGDFTSPPLYRMNSVDKQIEKIASSASAVGVTGAGANAEPPGFGAAEQKIVQGLFQGQSPANVAKQLDTWWDQNKGS